MKSKDFIKKALKDKNVTRQELANKLGYAGYQGVSNLINTNKSLTVESFVFLLEGLGYDLVAVDRESGVTTKIVDEKGEIKPRNIKGRPKRVEIESEKKEIPVFQYGNK